MEDRASYLFSKNHVWKPLAWKIPSWFGCKPDFEISAFMKQKCLSPGSPSSRVEVWAPLCFMPQLFTSAIDHVFLPLLNLGINFFFISFWLYQFLMISPSLLVLDCSGGDKYWPGLLLPFPRVGSRTGRELWAWFCCFLLLCRRLMILA